MKSNSTVHPLNPDNPTMDDDSLYAASCNDCTGLAATIAYNEMEAANYDEIVPYLPPVAPMPGSCVPQDSLTRAEGIHAEINASDNQNKIL